MCDFPHFFTSLLPQNNREGERGDDLLDFFSPLVLLAQMEYLEALEEDETASFGSRDRSNAANVVELIGGRDLLRYLKVPQMYINGMRASQKPRAMIPMKAPQWGVIVEHGASEGQYFEPWDVLFSIVDLTEIWVKVDIFEQQIAWVRPGLKAEIRTAAYPGRSWVAEIEFVCPEVHPVARTLRARLEFANPDELLLPNMLVEVVIEGRPRQDTLIIPREAVIKALGAGHFQPQEVVTGMRRGGSVEILSGLEEGDEIMLSGQFLIDSESSLQASFFRISGTEH